MNFISINKSEGAERQAEMLWAKARGMLEYWMKPIKRIAMPQSSTDQELESVARAGAAAKVSALLAAGADPMRESSSALRWAAYNGHEECVRLLLPLSDAKAERSQALWLAAQNGHVECVELLIPVSDPKADRSYALRAAAHYGHAECVRLLLPVSNPNECESDALRAAAGKGHAECVRLLLPVSDPMAEDSGALRVAARNGHVECVRLLLAAWLPLLEIDGLLKEAMDAGHAKVAALLAEEEPRLLDGVDLSKCHAAALERGHGDVASYLSSLMDHRELLGVSACAAACGGRRRARL